MRDPNGGFITIDTDFLKGRNPDAFLKIMKGKGVKWVIDIRDSPAYPIYYRPGSFAASCKAQGIDYSYIKLLGNPHRLAGAEVQLTPGFLLKGAGDKRRGRLAERFFSRNFKDAVIGLSKSAFKLVRLLFIMDFNLLAIKDAYE